MPCEVFAERILLAQNPRGLLGKVGVCIVDPPSGRSLEVSMKNGENPVEDPGGSARERQLSGVEKKMCWYRTRLRLQEAG